MHVLILAQQDSLMIISAAKKVGVAAIGDVLDIATWSNIPYYFYSTGEKMGYFNEPWQLNLSKFSIFRRIWNMKQIISGRGKGGYQYSSDFLDRAEGQIHKSYFASNVVSFNQVFPRATSILRANGKMFYYIDTTLNDLFNEPDYGINIPLKQKKIAIEQERKNYQHAEGVVVMGRWVEQSLLKYYKVPAAKISHILPGANISLPDGFNPCPFSPGAGITRDLVLGFVGKDWKRKGLLFLLRVQEELLRKGLRVKVRIIGNYPDELRGREGLECTGFIDKRKQMPEFIAAIASCDFGCLFSTTEALGISTLEFLRAGVPVMGFYYQGLKDTLLEGASLRFRPGESARAVAEGIVSVCREGETYSNLKDKAILSMEEVTWEKTVSKFATLVP